MATRKRSRAAARDRHSAWAAEQVLDRWRIDCTAFRSELRKPPGFGLLRAGVEASSLGRSTHDVLDVAAEFEQRCAALFELRAALNDWHLLEPDGQFVREALPGLLLRAGAEVEVLSFAIKLVADTPTPAASVPKEADEPRLDLLRKLPAPHDDPIERQDLLRRADLTNGASPASVDRWLGDLKDLGLATTPRRGAWRQTEAGERRLRRQ